MKLKGNYGNKHKVRAEDRTEPSPKLKPIPRSNPQIYHKQLKENMYLFRYTK